MVTAFEALERPYDLARVRHRLAEALLAGGAERPSATAPRNCSASPTPSPPTSAPARSPRPSPLLAQRARLALNAAPAQPAAPADPADSLGLTGRERDVLRLVAAGRTNRQIAEVLFISPKTASVHVSNILAKLGVSGRGEAAALAHRLGLFPAEPLSQCGRRT